MAEVPEDLRTALLDRYDVQRELGCGGMAVVYLARDLRYDRLVAIKVLNPELAASVGRARFLLEIDIAARLTHPHILPLFDSGEAAGLLYYVMPYVEGESLKDRIARETRLRVSDVISIARDVAAALDHAHAQGYVHRDVKPGNILLTGGSAVVTDFGIARAVRRSATDDTLTDVNLAIGTPHYMSPEQWAGTRELDARSDIYSLGCVVYEMLAGEPPFTGPTMDAIAARVAFDPPPPLRTVRPRVSPELEQAILTALEKVPADRYATAGEFARALEAAPILTVERPGPRPVKWPTPARWTGVLAAVAAIAWVLWRVLWPPPVVLDPGRYVVLPFRYESGISPRNEDAAFHDALRQWTGITIEDPFRVRDAMRRYGDSSLSSTAARDVARALGAGWYVRPSLSSRGDSIRVNAVLYSAAREGGAVHDVTLTLDTARHNAAAVFAALADSVLFRSTDPDPRAGGLVGTRSFPARQAYARGHRAIATWNLTDADSDFAAAAGLDDGYAQALLWLALVREWSDAPVGTWRSPIERAATRPEAMTARETDIAQAMLAAARGRPDRTCAVWTRLAAGDSTDFTSWYEKARCLIGDPIVVRDRTSPSGWRFRSSPHEAISAYHRALHLLPAIHESLKDQSYLGLRRLLYTENRQIRTGRAPAPDTAQFRAYPSLAGDTLAFVPFPAYEFAQLRSRVVPPTHSAAVRRQRELFREIATSWVTAQPRSSDAMLALAVSMDLLGNEAAVDTVRRARRLAVDDKERGAAAGTEFWMRVKYSLPDDLAGLHAARALGDSLLQGVGSFSVPSDLIASIATLEGRASRAVGAAHDAAERGEWLVPAPLTRFAQALMVFAALGGPADTLRALEERVATAISAMVDSSERARARHQWLERAAGLALPHQFRSLEGTDPTYYVIRADQALMTGDTAAVRLLFGQLRAGRRTMDPWDISIDAVLPEAWLLAEMGDTADAVSWLDPVLESLRATTTESFVSVARAGALVRAMAFRAELAAATGDREEARRWALPVIELWSDADRTLDGSVSRLAAIVAVKE